MPVAVTLPQHLWFLNRQLIVHLSCEDGADALSVLEHRAPYGDSPPLHLHRNEDEVYHVLDGQLRLRVGARELHLDAGRIFLAPKGIPHTYRVESLEGARWLTTTRGGDFERMARAFGRPAARDGLPEPSGSPTAEQVDRLLEVSLQHGIEFVGPPLR